MSDNWAAYNRIDQIGGSMYTHKVVIHENNFVDANDENIHYIFSSSLLE